MSLCVSATAGNHIPDKEQLNICILDGVTHIYHSSRSGIYRIKCSNDKSCYIPYTVPFTTGVYKVYSPFCSFFVKPPSHYAVYIPRLPWCFVRRKILH